MEKETSRRFADMLIESINKNKDSHDKKILLHEIEKKIAVILYRDNINFDLSEWFTHISKHI